ncbi:MAG: UPF0175 family protein [Candidatus Aminicenantes bacterium]|nr:UPF0175 family protein [Candidatus Aminicenantes bacterium]
MNIEISLDLPETVQLTRVELKMMLLYSLFEKGILSSGQAAKVAGVPRRLFLEDASKYGVSIFQYDAEEIEKELSEWQ